MPQAATPTTPTTGGPFDHPLSTGTSTPSPAAQQPTATGQPAPSSPASTSPTAPPTDPAATWRVGITRFKGIDLSSENDYLRESLPLLILDGLSGIATHRYSAAEKAVYQRKIVADALQAAEESLSDLRRKRSALFYETTSAPGGSASGIAPSSGGTAASAGAQAPASGAASTTSQTTATTSATGTASTTTTPATATSAATTEPGGTTAAAGASTTAPASTSATVAAPAASQSGAASPYAAIDASIADTLKRIAFLKQFDSALIAVAATKPVVVVTAGETAAAGGAGSAGVAAQAAGGAASPPAAPAAAAGSASAAGGASSAVSGASGAGTSQLLAFPVVSPAVLAKADSLDFLVSGQITEAEGYLIIEVSAYNADVGTQSYSFRTVVGPSEAFGALRGATDALASQVLGREWGTLRLAVEPSGSLVYVDGKFYGIGNAELRYLTTGRHEVTVEAPGYREERASVELEPLATKNLTISLKRHAANEIAIVTYPQGADVYLNSLWEGKSPLLVDRPLGPASLIIRREHFLDYSGILEPDSPPSTSIRLLPDTFKKSDYVNDLRNRFYASFGAFAVSVILPVTAYSLWQTNGIMYQESIAGSPEEARLKNLTTTWYYSLWGGVFISVSLFVNTVIDVIHYLRASD